MLRDKVGVITGKAVRWAMVWRRIVLVLGLGLGLASPARAHPHVFVDTALEVIFDAEGLVTGLRISWTYDDLFSLSVIADKGLDPDWDGKLTEAEVAKLSGPGFAFASATRSCTEFAATPGFTTRSCGMRQIRLTPVKSTAAT